MPHAAGLWYEWHGPEDGEVLILSAGLGGSAAYWTPNLAALTDRFRVLVYDHRGTGRSDRALPDPLTVEGMADDLLALMNALRIERAHILGHALGGMIGMAAALAAPERIARIVVINGWARLETPTARCFDVRLRILRDSGPEAYVQAQPIFLYPADWMATEPAAFEEATLNMLHHLPDRAVIEKRIAAIRSFDILERIDKIQSPVLVVSTGDDVLVPSVASGRLAERLPRDHRSDVLHIAWGGHAWNVTDPELFADYVPVWLAGEPIPEE
jgi:aminoacrylate hydrolase